MPADALFDAGKPAPKKLGPRPRNASTPCGHGRVGIPIDAERRYRGCPDEHRLVCAACGATWLGTDEEVALANAAQAAWERKCARAAKAGGGS
jgi:hypothetical protein